jgi:hypothetical protein
MVSIVNLVELIRVRKNRIGRHLICYKFFLGRGTFFLMSEAEKTDKSINASGSSGGDIFFQFPEIW